MLPPFPNKSYILQSMQRVSCAYFLGKMVETAAFKQNPIRFHNYSTSPCGFGRKISGIKYGRNTDPALLKGYFPGRGPEGSPNRGEVCRYFLGRRGPAKKFFEKSFCRNDFTDEADLQAVVKLQGRPASSTKRGCGGKGNYYVLFHTAFPLFFL